jgi:eukaryotic-like serine/threonine-protein kinase
VQARCPRDGVDTPYFWIVRDGRLIQESRLRSTWPILGVSWEDAQAYCRWRTARDGRAVGLPGEVEWERAVRGADGRSFPWGDGFSWGWTTGGRREDVADEPQPRPVGTTPTDVSPFGVLDLGGNMREWCAGAADDLFDGGRPCRGGGWTATSAALYRGANRSALESFMAKGDVGLRLRAAPRPR